jgi:hypothetical protein
VRRAGRLPTPRLTALAGVATVAATIGLAGCSSTQDGANLARQACVHVNRSVADFLRANQPSTAPADATRLAAEADLELRDALPLAAAANSDDGSWNSLMTTISEGATVDEGHLVPALRAQCALADANQNSNPQSPGSTTPQNVNPRPAGPANP